jgi:hypothetical protein
MIDPRMGVTVMKEVQTIAGVTPDEQFLQGHPNAVREWCINTAAVDPFTKSVLANSEDGKLYRWDLTTNTFTEVVTLTPGIGEAYTPTVIGVDGTVYAVNNATLFAVGRPSVPKVNCSVATSMLWPPDHQLVNVGLQVSASDELDPNLVIQIQVFANDGAGEGDAAVGADTLRLRGDRRGNGDGRVYLIVVTATNKFGEVGVSVCTVFVPHSNSPRAIASAQAQADAAEAFYLAFGEAPLGYSLIGKSPDR